MEKNTQTYFYALGRRKTAVATLRLYRGKGETTINDKAIEAYTTNEYVRQGMLRPFKVVDLDQKDFYFTVKVSGSGVSAQQDAISLALSRALVEMEPGLKKALKQEKLLTRDPRMVERKKPGLRKARRAEQYSKR